MNNCPRGCGHANVRVSGGMSNCENCFIYWDTNDPHPPKCGRCQIEPSPEEEFWFNITHTMFWLCCIVLTLLCVYIMQPDIIDQIRAYLLEILK